MAIEQKRSRNAVGREAGLLKRTFGEHASVYAHVRAQAAAMRGADEAAKHWRDIEQNVDASRDRDGQRT